MFLSAANSEKLPLFSIVIAVYNDWDLLKECLTSLGRETESFEVIIIDDGSDVPAPPEIALLSKALHFEIIRQEHRGIAAARNLGSQGAGGRVIVFLDADSRMRAGCLSALAQTVAISPQCDFFQLKLVGDPSTITGGAEELRLSGIQHHTLRQDGCIRYLNTAGFAVRRDAVQSRALFESTLTRAEDTFLLAELAEKGKLPFFVESAVVQHSVPTSLMRCFSKDIRSGLRERKAYALIASKGLKIRISNRERVRMLGRMWRASTAKKISKLAWFVLVMRQLLQRGASFLPILRRDASTQDLTIKPAVR